MSPAPASSRRLNDADIDRLLAHAPTPPWPSTDLTDRIVARATALPQQKAAPLLSARRTRSGAARRRTGVWAGVIGASLLAVAAAAAALNTVNFDVTRLAELPMILVHGNHPRHVAMAHAVAVSRPARAPQVVFAPSGRVSLPPPALLAPPRPGLGIHAFVERDLRAAPLHRQALAHHWAAIRRAHIVADRVAVRAVDRPRRLPPADLRAIAPMALSAPDRAAPTSPQHRSEPETFDRPLVDRPFVDRPHPGLERAWNQGQRPRLNGGQWAQRPWRWRKDQQRPLRDGRGGKMGRPRRL